MGGMFENVWEDPLEIFERPYINTIILNTCFFTTIIMIIIIFGRLNIEDVQGDLPIHLKTSLWG